MTEQAGKEDIKSSIPELPMSGAQVLDNAVSTGQQMAGRIVTSALHDAYRAGYAKGLVAGLSQQSPDIKSAANVRDVLEDVIESLRKIRNEITDEVSASDWCAVSPNPDDGVFLIPSRDAPLSEVLAFLDENGGGRVVALDDAVIAGVDDIDQVFDNIASTLSDVLITLNTLVPTAEKTESKYATGPVINL